MRDYKNILRVVKRAVYSTESQMMRDFMEVGDLQVSKKGSREFVTITDKRSEAKIYDALSVFNDNCSFLMEENGFIPSKNTAEYRFVVDALDGTFNFMRGIPYFAISIALERIQEDGSTDTVLGFIHSPLSRESFWAIKGQGAFHIDVNSNEKRMRVSVRQDAGTSSIALSMSGFDSRYGNFIAGMAEHGFHIRSTGSIALDMAYLALGKYDGLWYNRARIWDVSAGVLIIRESGGICKSIAGSDVITGENGLYAANNNVNEQRMLKRWREFK